MAKANNKEIELHNLIKNKDDLALAKLYDLYSESLVAIIKSKYQQASKRDYLFAEEAVTEALFGYYRNPDTFNPELNTLKGFLEMAAKRDMQNILDREKNHLAKEHSPEDVELDETYWNRITRNNNIPDSDLINSELLGKIELELEKHFDNQKDIQIAKMILSGERETRAFSEILKINTLTIEEQRTEVKKVKDRIKKVLERNKVELQLKKILK
ncbi:hypothetical protein MH928_04475 [Flavobacterium sp. WW92]|uniref:hypothetical protein n=1 Tax=unclassified Flavobacterium TaxID=196869 RepID=UPI0022250544|nr:MULTISPECIES: hypothetical protein [unclassified Flavobacterium]WDO13958.1 hypothetical protein MH928_04475 [Flavobacterium sp. WW92]